MWRVKVFSMFALFVLMTGPAVGEAVAEQRRIPGDAVPQDRQEPRDEQRLREEACDCCMKCMAATRETKGKEDGPPAENGCKDCCRRCGTTDLPTKRKMPPEIVK